MISLRYSVFTSFAVSVALALSGCGGGDDDSAAALPDPTGGDTITVVGPITGFGSIIVNGIRFETDGARVRVDDENASPERLRLGMVVTVQGSVDGSGSRGVADEIQYDDLVEGPIERITDGADADEKLLTVLSVRVRVHRDRTVMEGVNFDTLAAGQVVEISGMRGAGDIIEATRLERKSSTSDPDGTRIEIKGTVESVSGTTFRMGRFTVEFSGARLENFPGGEVLPGMFVEVKGYLSGDRIRAVVVEREYGEGYGDDQQGKVSLYGAITDFVDRSDFRVQGQRVDASGARLEPPGLELQNGLWVEVEGPIVGGVLQAYEVEAEGASSSTGGGYGRVELEGRITAVDPEAGVFTVGFVPGEVTVTVSPQTWIYDDRNGDRPIRLADLRAGDHVEVKGAESGVRQVAAGQIERDHPDGDEVQAPVTECIPGDRIVLLGLAFGLQDGLTRYEGYGDRYLADSDALCRRLSATGSYAQVEDWPSRRDGVADKVEVEGYGGYDDDYDDYDDYDDDYDDGYRDDD